MLKVTHQVAEVELKFMREKKKSNLSLIKILDVTINLYKIEGTEESFNYNAGVQLAKSRL